MTSRDLLVGGLSLTFAVVGFSLTGIWVRWLPELDPLAITAGRVAVALMIGAAPAWVLVFERLSGTPLPT